MVDSYLFGGSQSIALVALEVIFWTYTDLYLEKFSLKLLEAWHSGALKNELIPTPDPSPFDIEVVGPP